MTDESYVIKFYVITLEIMHFRNKNNKPCNENWREDDTEIRKKIMSNAGCVPPYWQTQYNMQYPSCSTREEMKTVYTDISWNYLVTPCRIISKSAWFDNESPTKVYEDKFANKSSEAYFSTRFYFPRKYFKDIHSVRAFNIETMIGNGGGYLGLCLGYSFLQLPNFIFELSKKARFLYDP